MTQFRRLMFTPRTDFYHVCETPEAVDAIKGEWPDVENVTGKDFHESRLAYVLKRGALAQQIKFNEAVTFHVENCGCVECDPSGGVAPVRGHAPIGTRVRYNIRSDDYVALTAEQLREWTPAHGPAKFADGKGGIIPPAQTLQPGDRVTIGSNPVQLLIGQRVDKFREIYDGQVAEAMRKSAKAEDTRLSAAMHPDSLVTRHYTNAQEISDAANCVKHSAMRYPSLHEVSAAIDARIVKLFKAGLHRVDGFDFYVSDVYDVESDYEMTIAVFDNITAKFFTEDEAADIGVTGSDWANAANKAGWHYVPQMNAYIPFDVYVERMQEALEVASAARDARLASVLGEDDVYASFPVPAHPGVLTAAATDIYNALTHASSRWRKAMDNGGGTYTDEVKKT